MPSKNPGAARHSTPADSSPAVDKFMDTLDHPSKPLIQAIRASILSLEPAIAEGVKWNAPSYRTTEYFATTNLREKQGVGIILHLGAKVRDLPHAIVIDDPTHLLKWLAKDRATCVFNNLEDFHAARPAFEQIIRQWIHHV